MIKSLRSEEYSEELKFLNEMYGADININLLTTQLLTFKMLIQSENDEYTCFDDILVRTQKMSKEEKALLSQIVLLCKLLNVNPATTSTGERSFSSARRLKTWLRSMMTQKRFNAITILNVHKNRTDNLLLHEVANDFVSVKGSRKRLFGDFNNNHFNRI